MKCADCTPLNATLRVSGRTGSIDNGAEVKGAKERLEMAFRRYPQSFGLYIRDRHESVREGRTVAVWFECSITKAFGIIGACRECDRYSFVGMLLDEMKVLRDRV